MTSNIDHDDSNSVSKLINDKEALSLKLKNVELSLADWIDRYNRRGEENDRLRQDIKLQGEEIMNIQSRLKEAQIALSESMEAKVPMQFEINKLMRERDSQYGNLKLLEDEVKSKTQQLATLNTHISTTTANFEMRLNNEINNNKDLTNRMQSLLDKISTQNSQLEENSKKIRILEESSSLLSLNSKTEIDNLKKYGDTYKKYFDEVTTKAEELEKFKSSVIEEHSKQISKLKNQMKQQIEKINETHAKQLEESDLKIKLLEQKIQQQSAFNVVPIDDKAGSNDNRMFQIPPGYESLGITEMLNKSMAQEKELVEERKKRSEAEMHLTHILKEIEAKKPILASQRRDYNRVVENYAMINKQNDEFLAENIKLKRTLEESSQQIKELTDAVIAQEQVSDDLSRQLQHILKQNFKPNTTSKNVVAVISDLNDEFSDDRLILYNSIEDLQQKNELYIRTIRKLEVEKERFMIDSNSNSNDKYNEDLLSYAKELASLREERQRTEEIVQSIIQERDAYKAIIDEADMSSSPLKLINNTTMSSYESNIKIVELEDEIKRLKNYNNRIMNAEEMLVETLEKTKTECSSLRLQVVAKDSDLRFYKDRSEKFENEIKSLQADNNNTNQRRYEIEKMFIDQQKTVRDKDDRLLEANDKAMKATENLQKCQIELEVLKASQKRLLDQIVSQREDLVTQTALANSIRRIETDLLTRAEAEKTILQQERDDLTKKVEALRKEVSQSGYLEDQKIQVLEDQLNKQRLESEKKTLEISNLQEELLREKTELNTSVQRALHLEKSLNLANERLDAITAAKVMDSVATNEAEQREAAFKKATSQLEQLTQQLSTAETQVEHYKKIFSKSEEMIKEMQERTAATKITREAEIKRLQTEVETIHKQLSESRNFGMELEKEVHESRELIKGADNKLKDGLKALEERAAASDMNAAKAQEQLERFKEDMVVLQKSIKEARSNYERELKLHSQAETSLREKEEELDNVKRDLHTSQLELAKLQTQLQNSTNTVDREQKVLLQENEELKEHLKLVKNTNDILQTELLNIKTFTDGSREVDVSIEILNDSSPIDETNTLRKHVATLNELLKNLKKDKDLQEAQISRVNMEKDNLNSTLVATQRALDEAKTSLLKEQEKKASNHKDVEYDRLKDEASRVVLLQDSNAYLHQQKEILQKKITKIEEELKTAKIANKPLQDMIAKLEKDKDSLQKVNEGLVNDNNYYSERLKKLYSNYDNVDPEEYRLLQVKIQQIETSNSELAADISTLRSDLESKDKLQAEKIAEFESKVKTISESNDLLVRTNTSLETNTNSLRNKLREMKAKLDETKAENTKLNETIKSHQTEKVKAIEEAKAALLGTQTPAKGKPSAAVATVLKATPGKPAQSKPTENVTATTSSGPSTPGISSVGSIAKTPSVKSAVETPVLSDKKVVQIVEATSSVVQASKTTSKQAKGVKPVPGESIVVPEVTTSKDESMTTSEKPENVTTDLEAATREGSNANKVTGKAATTRAQALALRQKQAALAKTDTMSKEVVVNQDVVVPAVTSQETMVPAITSQETTVPAVTSQENVVPPFQDTTESEDTMQVSVSTQEVVIPEVMIQETIVSEVSDQLKVEEQLLPPVPTMSPRTGRKRKNLSPSQTQQEASAAVVADTNKSDASMNVNTSTSNPIADEKVAAKAARTVKLKAQLEARKREAAKTAVLSTTEKEEEPASKKPRADNIANTTNPEETVNSSNAVWDDGEVIEHEIPTTSDDAEKVSKKARVEDNQSLTETAEESTRMNIDSISKDVTTDDPPAQELDVENNVVSEMEVLVEDTPEAATDIQDIEFNSKVNKPLVENSSEQASDSKDTTDVEPTEKKAESKLSFFKNPSLSQNTVVKKNSGNENSIFKSDSLGLNLNPAAIPFKPSWSLMPVEGKDGEEKPAAVTSQSFFVQKNPTPQSSPRASLLMPILKDSLFRKTPTSQMDIESTSTSTSTNTNTNASTNSNTNTSNTASNISTTSKNDSDFIMETAVEIEKTVEIEKSNSEHNIELEDGEIEAETITETPAIVPSEIKVTQMNQGGRGRGGAGRGRGNAGKGNKGTIISTTNEDIKVQQPVVPPNSTTGELHSTTIQLSIPIQGTQPLSPIQASTQSSSATTTSQAPTQPKHFRDMTDQEKKAYREKLMAERAEKLQKEKEQQEKGPM